MVDIDTTRINGSQIVALLLHLEIRKLRVNVFTGSLFLLAHFFVTPEPPPHFLKCKSLLFTCSCIAGYFEDPLPYFPIFHLKNIACW